MKKYEGDIRIQEAMELVDELNNVIYKKIGDTVLIFEINYIGYCFFINWARLQVWNSDDDERLWIGEGDDERKESLRKFIIDRLRITQHNIEQIKFDDSEEEESI